MNDTLERAAGVIMTGFDGMTMNEPVRRRLRQLPFAGFILFARNVATLRGVRALTDELRAFSDLAPIVAVDQEGGRVARLREGIEDLPAMMALGAARDPELARRAGEQLGFDLRRAGFTHDFAPVADLALDRENTVIGSRSFGASPELVVELAGAFMCGMQDAGMRATIKHFPGHGATAVDSHLALPVVRIDARALRERDFRPFERLAPGADAIMAAHVVVSAIDDALPASLSPRLLTGVLRDEWGYDGVCFTDCMQMDAIARGIGTVHGVAAAIAAGADCAIVSHDVEVACAAARYLAEEVEGGRIPRTRLDEAYARVMRLRERAPSPLPLDDSAPHPGVGREIARRAVTVIRGVAHADATGSVVVTFEGATAEGAQGELNLRTSLRTSAPALLEFIMPLEPSDAETGELLERIAASRRRPIVLVRRARLQPGQTHAVRCILARFPDALVACVREPYDCELFSNARDLIATYGDTAVSLGGLADVLFGDGDAQGVLPVDLALA